MNNIFSFNKEKLKTCIKLCWILLFLTWGFTILTGNKLKIVRDNVKFLEICNFIDSHTLLDLVFRYVSYTLQSIILIYGMLQLKILSKYKLFILSYITIIWSLKTLFYNIQILNYLDILYIVLIIIINRKRWFSAIVGIVFMIVITLVSSCIKEVSLVAETFHTMPNSMFIIFSLDIYIMCIIYYLYSLKGGFANVKQTLVLWKRKKLENINNSSSNSGSSTSRSVINCSTITKWYCKLVFFIIVYGLLVFIASFSNHIVEMTIIVFCFHIFRDKDSKTYHALYGTDVECFVESILTFGIVSLFEFSFTQSIYCSIMVAYLISSIAYFLQDYIDYKVSTNKLNNLTIETLDGICIKYNISELGKRRLKLKYIDKLTNKEIASLESVELDSIEEYFRTIRKRLK